MIPSAAATDRFLTEITEQVMEQLDGIPDDDLNQWRPKGNLRDINTFYIIATHLVGSGEYWIWHLAGGRPLDRDRAAEFQATGTFTDLKARYDRWLTESRSVLESLTDADLGRTVDVPMFPGQRWTIADCLVHGVEHSALHLGHIQIQRQFWDAEQAGA